MANQNRANFIVDLTGNVLNRARQFGASIRSMGADGSRSMRLFQGATGQVNRVLDRFDSKLMGFVTGGSLVMMSKRVGDQQQQLTELGTRYNMTADQLNKLNESMWQASAERKLPYADVLAAADKFLEKTNDTDAALEHMDSIALAIKGVGLEAQTSGVYLGTLWNKGIKDAGTMLRTLDGIASVSMTGTGNLSEQLDGLIGLTHGTSWQKPEELMQLLKMQRLGDAEFGSSGQTAAALQQMHDALKDKDKRRVLERNGVKVWKDKSKSEFVSPSDLMLDIGNRSKYKERNLKQVFSGDMLELAMSFDDKDKQQQLKAPDATIEGLVTEKASRNVSTFNGALTSLANAGERWANLNLAGPIESLAEAINDLSPEELDRYADTIKNVAIGIGGVIVARKAYRGGMAVRDWWKGPGAGGPGAGAGGLGNGAGGLGNGPVGGVQRVFVTNWPSGGLNNNGGGNPGQRIGNDVRGGAVTSALTVLSMLPEKDERMEKLDEYRQNELGGREAKYTWLPPALDKWLQEKQETQAPITTYQQQQQDNVQTVLGMPYGQQPTPQKPPEGEIKLKVELPPGATVASTQVKSSGVGISVNTGNTYTGPY